jgi:tetratricopeptide (TPR) repeat protein
MLPDRRPLYEDLQQRRAFLSVTVGQFGSAIPILQEILSFNLTKEIRSNALTSLGRSYLENHEWLSARDCFLRAEKIGFTSEQEKTVHFFLGIACFYLELLVEAKHEFQICVEHAAEYELPITDAYNWLSATSRRLKEFEAADRYARLAKVH